MTSWNWSGEPGSGDQPMKVAGPGGQVDLETLPKMEGLVWAQERTWKWSGEPGPGDQEEVVG